MQRLIFFLAACLLLARPVLAEVSIDGPDGPVQPGRYVQLDVRGIPDEALPKTKLIHFPRDDVQVIPAKTWGGDPFILFLADQPGNYLLAVAVVQIEGTGVTPPKLIDAVSLDYAEIVIQVGEDPGPSKNPYPPPGPEWKARVVAILNHQLSRPDATALAKLYHETSEAVQADAAHFPMVQDLADYLYAQGEPLGLRAKYVKFAARAKYVKFAATMNGVYGALFGERNQRLDPQRAAEALDAMAYTIWETGK